MYYIRSQMAKKTITSSTKKTTKARHSVYVVELRKSVYTENRKFREANPQYKGVLECLYVGMTSKSPKMRLSQHINGVKSKRGHNIASSIVRRYGMYLRPSLYSHLNPLTKTGATNMEKALADKLKKEGYAVWWN